MEKPRKKIVIRPKPRKRIVIKNVRKNNYKGDLSTLAVDDEITIGSSPSDTIQLDSPLVDRKHITLKKMSDGRLLLTNHSERGVYVKGKHVKKRLIINKRDHIKINSYDISPIEGVRDQRASDENIIVAKGIKKVYPNGNVGLHKMNLAIPRGCFVALMGPSGCGKSTLLKCLNAVNPVTEGNVHLFGFELNSNNYNAIKDQIGYVPQDDIVHQALSVKETLWCAAKLRLVNKEDTVIEARISKILRNLGIDSLQKKKVGELSGGQRKRVSIAVELLSDPDLLFMDEPTSPLDPQTIDGFLKAINRLVKTTNTTVIMVTHKPSDLNYVDRVIFLAKGGYPAYYGPVEACYPYFGVAQNDITRIYHLLSSDKGDAFHKRYQNEHHKTSNVHQPSIRKQHYNENLFSQLYWLTYRYGRIKFSSKWYVLFLVAQPLFIASAVSYLFSELTIGVLFLTAISAIWFGLSNAAKEIVDEQAIYKRERMYNLDIRTYISSKLLVLGLVAAVQVVIFAGILKWAYAWMSTEELPVIFRDSASTSLFLFYLTLSGTLIGLLLSAMFKKADEVMTWVPIVLIPQIMFAGVIAKVDQPLKKAVSWSMIGRWGTEGLARIQDNASKKTTLQVWEKNTEGVYTLINHNSDTEEGTYYLNEDDKQVLSSIMRYTFAMKDSILEIETELRVIEQSIEVPTEDMITEPTVAVDQLDLYDGTKDVDHNSFTRSLTGNVLFVSGLNFLLLVALYYRQARKDSI